MLRGVLTCSLQDKLFGRSDAHVGVKKLRWTGRCRNKVGTIHARDRNSHFHSMFCFLLLIHQIAPPTSSKSPSRERMNFESNVGTSTISYKSEVSSFH